MKPGPFIFVIAVFTSFGVSSQAITHVGQIGQNQKKYEKIVASHQMQLLEVCDNNLDSAYQIWIDVMTSLEDYSESVNFDVGILERIVLASAIILKYLDQWPLVKPDTAL